MLGLSMEHVLILGIVLLIFGPKRLPELGRTFGKTIKNFKDGLSGVEEAKFKHLPSTDAQKELNPSLTQTASQTKKEEL